MKPLFTYTACAAVLTFAGDRLTLREEADQSLQRTFLVESEMQLAEMSMSFNGEEQANPMMDEMEQAQARSFRLVVTDTIEKAVEGRATAFRREFEEISETNTSHMSMPMMDPMDEEVEESSELTGKTVVFREGEEGFEASFPEDRGGDEELLEGLAARLDLALLLPEEEVEEGDTWYVDLEVFEILQDPGGDLHLEADEGAGGPGGLGMMVVENEERAEPEGELLAEYLGQREEDGRELAAIQLTVDLATFQDLTDLMAEMSEGELPDDAPPEAIMPEIESAEMERTYEGEGLVLWDLEAGRLHSLDLELGVVERQTLVMLLDHPEMDGEIEQTTVMEGFENFEVRCDG